jgi:signal peptidase I
MSTQKDNDTAPSPKLRADPKQKPKQGDPSLVNKEEVSEVFKTVVIAFILALFIRTFLYEPFNIPSGSMLPTLLVGDYLFVSKPAYGYSHYSFPLGIADFEGRIAEEKPERGDVVVFKLPSDPSIDYIKRIVALPGETVQVIRGRLYINGEQVEREPIGLYESAENGNHTSQKLMEYIETLPGGVMHSIYEVSDNADLDNTQKYTVPEGHYFMMGDNRDNSQDSRVQSLVGFVPFENIIGRADILFFSVDEEASLFNPLTWPGNIRFSRILNKVGPIRHDLSEELETDKAS